MHVLGQTLTPDSRAWVLGKATAFGDEWLEREIREKREHKIALLPIGSQVIATVNYKLALTKSTAKNWTTKAFAICSTPNPVFLPGKAHGQRSLIGYSPWGRKELEMTEWCHFTLQSLNPKLLLLLTFSKPCGNSGWSKALCAPGNLVGQVFR